MPYLKLDVSFPEHPKVVDLGPEAPWLYVCGLAWSARLMTDGKIPKGQVGRLSTLRRPQDAAAKLVTAGLWDDEGDHYRIHDYLEHQTSRAEIEKKRADARDRAKKVRANTKRTERVTSPEVRNIETEVEVETPQTPRPSPVESPTAIAASIGELRSHL